MADEIVLWRKLDDAFEQSYKESRKLDYNPARFFEMMCDYKKRYDNNSSVHLAKDLIQGGISYGLEKLRQMKRLDLSVEAIVLNRPWKKLFDDDVLEQARNNLEKFGYINPPEFEEAG